MRIARVLCRAGIVLAAAPLSLGLLSGPAAAEPALDRILSGAQVTDKSGCAILRVDFNVRIRYISHFPIGRGDQLSIRFAAIDMAAAEQELLSRQEAIPAPGSKIAAIRSIEFDARGAPAPELLITFKHPVSFRVAEGGDFQSLVIAIAGPGGKPCDPAPGPGSAGGWQATVLSSTLPPAVTAPGQAPASGKLSAGDRAAVSALMDRAREALGAGDQDAAIKALTRVLGYPTSEVTQEATELLGLAHQRKGEIAKARTMYQDYLSRYPGGDDAKRVRERLASLDNAVPGGAVARKLGSRETHFGQPGQPAWIITGSASQTYMRDDSVHNYIDPSLPPQINQPADQHMTLQNELLSSLDVTALWGNSAYQSKFRFSGALEDGLGAGDPQIGSLADFELDTTVKDWGVTTKLGRQTHNTGGVLGRFDGGLVSWDALPGMRFDTVVGSPVALRRDRPFKDGTFFYGEAVDFASLLGPFDTTFYAIEQRTGEFIDRQAVGTELRYAGDNRSAFVLLDYDTHANMIGSAIANGTWTLADKSTFTASVEHRSSPELDTRDALIGQSVSTLTDLLAFYSKDEIYQLAKDRTAYADTASVGFSRPLSEHTQISMDASWLNLTATQASGSVDANPDSGNEYYLSGQIIGNDLLKPSDLYVLGLRYATTADTKTYVADVSARYPVSDKLRINPRLRVGYRNGDAGAGAWEEYSVLPSLKLDYQWSRNLGFELESGAKYTEKLQSGTRDNQTDYFITVGYRYDFNAEGGIVVAGH